MKRMLCLLLLLCMLLSGCGMFGERIKEPVTFYYLCAAYQEDLCCAISSEEREASGHTGDLSYLLALYLMGPSGEDLVTPLPRGTRIYSAKQEEYTVLLNMSDTSQTLTDAEFSLACACLTMTCLDMTDAEQVTITSGSRSATMHRDNLTLTDNSTATETTEDNG